jgi:uncharacterized protein YjbI with pentapeptide repeats
MARQTHLNRLKRGDRHWNQWRKEYPLVKPNLNKIELLRQELRGINFQETELKQANLKGVNLQGANISWANLQGVNLSEADLTGADLSYAILEQANLEGANLSHVNLVGADCKKTNLAHANLDHAQAQKTNFSQAILTGVCIQDWEIDNYTNLDAVICDYVYLMDNQRERRPCCCSENFADGEFAYLFQKVLKIKEQPINQLFDYYITQFWLKQS